MRDNETMKQTETDVGIAQYTEALLANPNDAEAYRERGWLYYKKDEYDNAIADFNEALRLNPNDAAAYGRRGDAYCEKEDYDNAISDYTGVIRLTSSVDTEKYLHMTGYYRRALAYKRKCDWRNALADIDELIRLDPNGYEEYGYSAYREKGCVQAIVDAIETVRANPDDPSAYFKRGEAYRNLYYANDDALNNAIADYTNALRLAPEDAAAYIGRGRAYTRKGEFDAAIADFSEALRLKPDCAETYIERGRVYKHKGCADNAIADFSDALRLDPDNAEAYRERGWMYKDKNDYDAAIADYTEVGRLERQKPMPQTEGDILTQAEVDRLMGWEDDGIVAALKREQAVYKSAEALRANPNDAEAHFNSGIAYMDICRHNIYHVLNLAENDNGYNKAVAGFTEAIRLKPDYAEAYLMRGQTYLYGSCCTSDKDDLHGKAIADYTETIRLKPDCAEAYCKRGGAYTNKDEGNRDQIADYSEAIRLKPDYAEAYYHRGSAYWKNGDLDKAIEDYSKVANLPKPETDGFCESWNVPIDLYLARADKRFEDGEYDLAIADYTEAVSLNPYRGSAFYKRGTAYALKGDEDNAFESYCDAIRASDNLKARIARGAIYNKRKMYEDAVKDFSEVLRREPDNAEAKAGLEEASKSTSN